MNKPLFSAGQAVILIDANFALVHTNQILNPHHPPVTTPTEGPVYHVRDIFIFPHAVGITLEEITNPTLPPGLPEPNWNQEKFAPVPDAEVLALTEVEELETV